MFQVSQHEASEQAEKVRYPPCNSRWNGEKEEGKVWCTARSGGNFFFFFNLIKNGLI